MMADNLKMIAVNIKAGLFPYSDGSGYELEVCAEHIPGERNTLTLSNHSDRWIDFDLDQWEVVREAIDSMVCKVRDAQKRNKK